MNKFSTILFQLLFLMVFLLNTSTAHSNPFSSINIANKAWNCSFINGAVVPIYLDPNLPNVGMATAYPPQIVLNPLVMNQYSPTMQIFWLAHECSHAVQPMGPGVNPEAAADCLAIRQLRYLNLNVQQLQEIAYQTLPLMGSYHTGHLPGPQRAQHMINCYMS